MRTRTGGASVVLTMQAILITTSLLLVAGMLGSLAWLSVLRMRRDVEIVPVEARDEPAA